MFSSQDNVTKFSVERMSPFKLINDCKKKHVFFFSPIHFSPRFIIDIFFADFGISSIQPSDQDDLFG